MKENMEKLDQVFGEVFAGFEESPPPVVKSIVFRRLLLFNTWQTIRKYFIVSAILLLIGSITYLSGAILSGKPKQFATHTNSAVNQQFDKPKSEIENKQNYGNTFLQRAQKKYNRNQNKTKKTPTVINKSAENNKDNLNKSEKVPFSDLQKSVVSNNSNNTYNTLQLNDKTINSFNKQSITQTNENIAKNKTVEMGKSTVEKENIFLLKNIFPHMVSYKYSGNCLNHDNNILVPIETSAKSQNKTTPLLWSIGINLGYNLIQSNFVNTTEKVSDDNYNINTSVHFPSGHIGLSVRGEKRHLLFDFGMKYSHYSEKITANQQLYNEHQYQNIAFLGQNTIIDTNGAYWHYFYVSTTTIRKIDSIWTWRIDSSWVSLYDTTYKKRYDTLKNSSWVNVYSSFEFPLNIGWMKNYGRVNIGISTGPIFSILVGTRGKMPYHITSDVELIALNQEFKAFKFGLSWQVSGLLNYHVSDRMMVEFMPYYRQTLVPFKSSSSSAVIKNNSFGIQFGCCYYF